MKVISYFTFKKDLLRHYIGRHYYQYGLFCSTHPLMLILMSCVIIIFCSLPLTSFPIFEKILAFLFQRIQVNYNTVVSKTSVDQQHDNVFAYIQQIKVNATIKGKTRLSSEDIIESILQLPAMHRLEKSLRQPKGHFDEIWDESCLKLYRDPPSMKALKKRIKYVKGSIHNDLRMRRFYLLECLFVSPNVLFDNGQSEMSLSDFTVPFQELTMGYPMQRFTHVGRNRLNSTTISFMFTLFLKKHNKRFQDLIIADLKSDAFNTKVSVPEEKGHKIYYKLSYEAGPAELIPLTIAYVVVFFYLWFSVAKLDLIRTRWGLAFSAVMNCILSFTMAIGICATFDVLPTTLNVGEIFPYVVILIGIENFWIITKSVMTTRKDLQVKDRVARGLGMEGWYITKNLVVELLLLCVGYISRVKGVQEFSVFALACYLSDFFLQMTFFTPILAVDIRRAEVGLPFTNRSAWKYAFYIDIEKPGGIKQMTQQRAGRFSAAVKMAFSFARYRVLQRTVMVLIVLYFILTLTLPIQEMVSAVQNKQINIITNRTTNQMSCWTDGDVYYKENIVSWLFLCGKHWPELFNYYFVHLNEKNIVVLPQIDVLVNIPSALLKPTIFVPRDKHVFYRILIFLQETSKPIIAVCCIMFLTVAYKLGSALQSVLQQLQHKTDVYTCVKKKLSVPSSSKRFLYKLIKMVVDETDSLVCAFNNGAVYVWDLYDGECSFHINRRCKEVQNLRISRSVSTLSLPSQENIINRPDFSTQQLPRAVWSLAYKSDVLIVGCDNGTVEVYSLENHSLQCVHESRNTSGVVSVKIISCLRFVIAHKNGVVEFCHIKTKNVGHKRTNSLPNSSHASREIEISRSVVISHSSIIYMDIAIDKIYVVSLQGQVKVLRASDDGGIPLQSQLPRDQEVTAIKVELSPEMAIIGTSVGNVYILNSLGQTVKSLSCGDDEVMSVSSDDDYIAVLAYDGVLTVWLKEGYIKWWQLNLMPYGGAYEIVSLARYSLAAVTKDNVILLNVVSRVIVSSVVYDPSPTAGLIIATPVVCQNRIALAVPTGNTVTHLKFPKLTDYDR
ncbi:uncharacterized protein LOC130622516 isoform X1 [Hydractinia symbiolongicarpus]|uniref:uncharacterized protein LOC130622516 isoform X1 n=1 Tax=Hydractinia symbiolongicarpus TaxID=13093 RepID=UPI00254C8001|nr:uncharacterized protein LOC130622516 isoform X1 [Hydractinia symbiolongicarpus]